MIFTNMSLKPLFECFTFINRFVIDHEVLGGQAEAFDDARFPILDGLYSVAGQRILELAPLEGVQTIQLHQRGAREIVCIEGREHNYYKWCLIKELYQLDRARIYLGDLDHVDLRHHGMFDLCLCFGILYHLDNPADLLLRIAEITSRVYIWTHFADDVYPESPESMLRGTWRSGQSYAYRGKYYREEPEPRASLRLDSFWPFEDELVRMLKDAGFDNVRFLARGRMYEKLALALIYAQKGEQPTEDGTTSLSAPVNPLLVEGWLDVADMTRVSGWVWAPESPATRVRVSISVDGELVGKQLAYELRSDLRSLGKGDGAYGFTFSLPQDGKVKDGSIISVYVGDPTVQLEGSPKKL